MGMGGTAAVARAASMWRTRLADEACIIFKNGAG